MNDREMEILLGTKVFASLGEKTLSEWVKSKAISVKSLKKGETVLEKDNFSRCLIAVLKGSLGVSKICADGKKALINELGMGDVFGMATLFYEQKEYPATITAQSPCRICIFPKELIEKAFAENQDFARSYVVLLSEKIHFLNGKVSAFAESENNERLLRYITEISHGETEFDLPCSVSRLSEIIGVPRISVYRAFDSLEEKKLLKKSGKHITIQNHERQ